MDYQKIYNSIIQNRLNNPYNGYTETHHIVPKSLGGLSDNDNLVKLTAREHFICHVLLVKIHEGTRFFYPMIKALGFMSAESEFQNRYFNSHLYQYFREAHSKSMSISQSGKHNSNYGTKWVYNLDLKQCKKINKSEKIPIGWKLGRIMDWDKKELEIKKLLEKEKFFESEKEKYENFYNIYNQYGWEKFKKITGYNKSQPNLIRRFIKYVEQYNPQMGKPRGGIKKGPQAHLV